MPLSRPRSDPASNPNTRAYPPRSWKGKERELAVRDGGNEGTVIDLELLQDSLYQSAYVAPVYVGSGNTKHLVQVDTGSSDLWITSTSCSSSLCNQVGGSKYDASGSIPTGRNVQIQYAEGEVDGPIVWDSVQLGGYDIDHQALISAANVNDEPLSSSFTGVMGLALPANSLIAQQIPPTESDAPDGASLSSNLFSITPVSTAPGARFFGLALERPGSSRVPSVLGIGKHPPDVVPDPSKVEYANVIASSGNGPQWWQASVREINVYVDGVRKPVVLPQSASGLSTPTAILDSGVPLIITTNAIANGIYGALGISPADNGNYYLPCTTPINMTIQLDGRTEIPIHPLDMSYFPPNDASSENCIGVIQTPSQFPGLQLQLTDMILGVPFLRNTYTVLAYDPPFENGSFPMNTANGNMIENVRPRLGLMNLTDPAVAADEFHTVRVLKQSLGSAKAIPASHSKGLSVGVEVLIGLLGFFALCFALFGARWAYMRRKYSRERAAAAALEAADPYHPDKGASYVFNELGYQLTPMKPDADGNGPTEDELRQKRFESYKRRQRQRGNMDSSYTDDTATTRVGSYFEYEGKPDEFGKMTPTPTPGIPDTPDTPQRGYFDPWGDTLVEDRRATLVENPADFDAALLSPPPRSARRADSPRMMHHRTHSGGPGADTPLLSSHAHHRSLSGSGPDLSTDIAEFGMDSPQTPMSMAGVGTARRSRRISGMSGMTGSSPAPSPGQEHPPRVRRSNDSGNQVAAPPPAVVPSSDAVVNTSRNDSRVSIIGHEP